MCEQNLINEINSLKKDTEKLEEKINLMNHRLDMINDLMIYSNKISPNPLNYCPICGEVTQFKPFGKPQRNNSLCPTCRSLERQRLSYYIFKDRYPNLFSENIKLLHFGPERVFFNLFSKLRNVDYYPVDFAPEIYESRGLRIRHKVNMENIPYGNDEFDMIYNSHVLEHVPNDIKGMGELYRVLKPDGICFTMVPLFNINHTIEDKHINTPELRLKYYGQADHLRKYGKDFKNKLESVGFNVEEVKSKDIYKNSMKKEFYGLLESESLFICTK